MFIDESFIIAHLQRFPSQVQKWAFMDENDTIEHKRTMTQKNLLKLFEIYCCIINCAQKLFIAAEKPAPELLSTALEYGISIF